ncbi:MAG: thioredoxin domain-containing protein [Gemmatimonadota bacterium]|nr:thioredoxin domain-containing protein [Gemmatimonadota bacterium]
MPNRLAGESSPYLLQHANNPVDWYPWGDEALTRARQQHRPILLSVGYAACHWCHVMAHESFEDPATAAVMNEHFVCVKVDREERPDLDAIYMQAVQAMTGHGGWPMTVFLTPDGAPFYGGTYFPPTDRHGMPAFTRILKAVADSYAHRPESIAAGAESMRAIYAASRESATGAAGALDESFLERAARAIESRYDPVYGGFDSAPKFPPTMLLDFLLRHWARTGEDSALRIVRTTFSRMARGGIYDQIGGGFARYSVDAHWLVPHFEKMLYDNALLIRLGAHLYEATHDEEVRRVTDQTVEWLSREMTSQEGGFYSSLDADSDGHEGKFYIWSSDELDSVLGPDAAMLTAYYGVTDSGNFEGRSILHVAQEPGEFARAHGLDERALQELLSRARRGLYERRAGRVWPARDDKILAGWNGLALRAITEAARAFDREDFRALAARNATFLLTRMVVGGRVMRAYNNGVARIRGFLEDQAAVALGFLAMFESSLDIEWLDAARILSRTMMQSFWNEDEGTFYDTADDAEQLVSRPRDPTDNAIPSGTSLAVDLLLRLAHYDDDDNARAVALRVIESVGGMIERYPSAFGHMLGDAEYALAFACHGDYCDMPSPGALAVARAARPDS